MKLIQSNVVFNQEEHTYTLNGERLEGITGMLSRQLFPDKYNNVPDFVLERARQKGTMIHEVCELIDEVGIEHNSPEGKNYVLLREQYGLLHEASEYLVSDNEHYASCIDKVYREGKTEFTLADIKTTRELDTDYVRWQLSVYAYLFELQNPECKAVRLLAIWLRGDEAKIVEVKRIPDNVIINLLSADICGLPFINPYVTPVKSEELPAEYRKIEQYIIEIDEKKKDWEEKRKTLLDGVLKEMVRAGVYKWEGEKISFTRKKASVRKTFDKKNFEKDHKKLYEEYLVESLVSESIILKIK